MVQNLDGGIVAEILMREGDSVRAGDVLVRIDDTNFASTFRENQTRPRALLARMARLEAETTGKKLAFPPEVLNERQIIAAEIGLYQARQQEIDASVSVLQRQVEQREQEIVELTNKITKLEQSLELARQERDIQRPMVAAGVTSRIELLRLDRQVTDLEREMEGARLSMPRVRSALSENRRRVEEKVATFRSQAQADLTDTSQRVDSLRESIEAMRDKVVRAEVRAPVSGVVKQVKVATIGGGVQPGMGLVEIVPIEDTVVVEAKIRPSDIAFLRPN